MDALDKSFSNAAPATAEQAASAECPAGPRGGRAPTCWSREPAGRRGFAGPAPSPSPAPHGPPQARSTACPPATPSHQATPPLTSSLRGFQNGGKSGLTAMPTSHEAPTLVGAEACWPSPARRPGGGRSSHGPQKYGHVTRPHPPFLDTRSATHISHECTSPEKQENVSKRVFLLSDVWGKKPVSANPPTPSSPRPPLPVCCSVSAQPGGTVFGNLQS